MINEVELKNMMPFSINFGTGEVCIMNYTTKTSAGLILKCADEKHEVGEHLDINQEKLPELGEVYLDFKSLESLQVFMDMMQKVYNELLKRKYG